jgi:hypothetical protein
MCANSDEPSQPNFCSTIPRMAKAELPSVVFQLVSHQMLTSDVVEIDGRKFPVRRTSAQHLRTVTFSIDNHEYTAIEQNPDKPSRWGQLARAGHKVVQFKNQASNRFVAVSVDGEVKTYAHE